MREATVSPRPSARQPRRRRFYDAWESADATTRGRLMRRALEQYVGFAASRVPFYRDRLAPFDPKAEQPLSRVPVLRSEELRELLPPKSDRLLADRSSGYTVFQSGGTTGFPKTTLFSHEELHALYGPNARGFWACGLEPGDRVANLFAVGGLYMTFLHIHAMLERYGCMNFPFANHTPPDFIHTVARLFNINAVAGIASVAMSALRGMERLGLDGIRIEKLYYGGEHLYEADKRELRERFGIRTILAPGYGTVESWYIGYQCHRTPTGVFHAHDDQTWIEIVDEESGRHARPGEIGMLYATAMARRLTPIIRYRVGDRARWLGAPCPCGRTTPLFELLGRGDDVLRIGYDSIDYRDVQQAVLGVRGLSGTVQIEKARERGRDRLIVRVESRVAPSRRAGLARSLGAALLARRPTLRKLVEEKFIWPVAVELKAPGELPRNPRTGKLNRVVDLEP